MTVDRSRVLRKSGALKQENVRLSVKDLAEYERETSC